MDMNISNTDSDSTTNSTDNISTKVRVYFLVGLILMLLWTVLIIGLNLAVIIIIYRYKKRTRLYFFLFHLAVADLLTGIIHCIPNSIGRAIGSDQVESVWLAGDILCKLQWTLGNVTIMTSNYVLACMSIDRAFAVCRPMKSLRKGYLAQKLSIIACWIFSLLLCSPYLKLVKTYPNFRSKRPTCVTHYKTTYDYKVELILKLVFIFIIPLTLIVISYGSLLFVVYTRASGSLKENDQSQRLNRVFNGRIPKTKMKSIKLTIGIVLSFVVCWGAHFAGHFMGVYGGIRHPIFLIMTTFYYLNSVANPILFFIYHRNKTFRLSKSSYSSHHTRRAENSGNEHQSAGSRVSFMKDCNVDSPAP